MRHRLMAEFAMGIPNDQLRRFAEIKHVLRHAMTGILPEVVRQRRSKAEGSSHLFRALEATGGALFFKELNIERLGWVNGGLIRNMYEQMADLYNKQDFAYRSYVWPLWITLSLELWYREVFLHFDEKST
jgi:hypothetical protein